MPRLTLIGFGRGGRACDAAVGGAIVYATPIRKDIWLVASAGILYLPQALAGTPRATGQARVDLVFAQPKGPFAGGRHRHARAHVRRNALTARLHASTCALNVPNG